ncbi:MAG: GNAT family N-acetyltransferase [Candidatus Thiodiazotropha endolucinida]|nr:GNAT family N-acetyltransferase [Candidatus Thiodiazotropha taylori]MCW4318203.1 GNAT family N-acetyltransferase [Candidatus Thiodiazotropha taylori]
MNIKEESIRLRPAKPEFEEGLKFAHYLDQAAEGFFRAMLGPDSEAILASAFIDSDNSLSYEHVIFAEIDKKTVGMSSSFSEQQQRKFSDEPLQRAAKKNAIRLKLLRILFSPIWRILETIPEGDYYIQGIAIDPEFRGRGIGSLLMDDIESRAKADGFSRLSLDVSAKNEGARRLYKRLGMVESSTWPSSKILPTVFIRMSKYL